MTRARLDGSPAGAGGAMGVLAGAVFAGAVSLRCLDALLPDVSAAYGSSVGGAGAVVTAYALSYSGLQLAYGPLGDRVGPFKVVAWATILSCAAAFACAFAPTLNWLIGLRFLSGAAAAAIGPTALAWVSYATRDDRRSVVVANMTAASITGATGGQIGGGALGALFGWRSVFVSLALLFAISAIVLAIIGRRRPDLQSLGRRRDDRSGEPSQSSLASLMRRPAVQRVVAATAAEGFAMFLSFPYLAALLHERTPSNGAVKLLVAVFGAGGIVFVLLARRIVSALSERRRSLIGGCLAGAGFLAFAALPSPAAAAAALLALGFGFFMLHNVLQVRATNMAPAARGAALSLFAASFFLSQALGSWLGGWTFDHVGPSASLVFSGLALPVVGWAIARFSSGPDRLAELADRPASG